MITSAKCFHLCPILLAGSKSEIPPTLREGFIQDVNTRRWRSLGTRHYRCKQNLHCREQEKNLKLWQLGCESKGFTVSQKWSSKKANVQSGEVARWSLLNWKNQKSRNWILKKSPVGKVEVYSSHQQGHSRLTSKVLKLQPLFYAALEHDFVGISAALKGFTSGENGSSTVPVLQMYSVTSRCFYEDKMRECSTLQMEKLWKMTEVTFCCHAISGLFGLLLCYCYLFSKLSPVWSPTRCLRLRWRICGTCHYIPTPQRAACRTVREYVHLGPCGFGTIIHEWVYSIVGKP